MQKRYDKRLEGHFTPVEDAFSGNPPAPGYAAE